MDILDIVDLQPLISGLKLIINVRNKIIPGWAWKDGNDNNNLGKGVELMEFSPTDAKWHQKLAIKSNLDVMKEEIRPEMWVRLYPTAIK